MIVWYNEIDPYAAQWLRNLIDAGHIAPGVVDERDIRDIEPGSLAGFSQCHFFAGIGGWSYALRLTGWPDDRPVWTGSCPCQPFSAAGKGGGFADERHLWPAFFHLIDKCRPAIVFGEQVASKDGLAWLDLVQADLEGAGYAVGAADMCAAGVGAPHIRQRLWWVADSSISGRRTLLRSTAANGRTSQQSNGHSNLSILADAMPAGRPEWRSSPGDGQTARSSVARLMAHSSGTGLEIFGEQHARTERPPAERGGAACELAHSNGRHACAEGLQRSREYGQQPQNSRTSLWASADWLPCRDDKWRPVEPGTFPLAHGVPARVGRLRAYGNAIIPQVAAEFIGAYLDIAG